MSTNKDLLAIVLKGPTTEVTVVPETFVVVCVCRAWEEEEQVPERGHRRAPRGCCASSACQGGAQTIYVRCTLCHQRISNNRYATSHLCQAS